MTTQNAIMSNTRPFLLQTSVSRDITISRRVCPASNIEGIIGIHLPSTCTRAQSNQNSGKGRKGGETEPGHQQHEEQVAKKTEQAALGTASSSTRSKEQAVLETEQAVLETEQAGSGKVPFQRNQSGRHRHCHSFSPPSPPLSFSVRCLSFLWALC